MRQHATVEGKRLKRRRSEFPEARCKPAELSPTQLKSPRWDLQALTRTVHAFVGSED